MASLSLVDFPHAVMHAEQELGGGIFFPCPLRSYHANGIWTLKTRDNDVICEISNDGILLVSAILRTAAKGHSSQVRQVLKDRWEFHGPKGFYAYVEALTCIEASRKGWALYLQSTVD